jgi:hypothetical protein
MPKKDIFYLLRNPKARLSTPNKIYVATLKPCTLFNEKTRLFSLLFITKTRRYFRAKNFKLFFVYLLTRAKKRGKIKVIF